jgi:hypothetical protein
VAALPGAKAHRPQTRRPPAELIPPETIFEAWKTCLNAVCFILQYATPDNLEPIHADDFIYCQA